MANWPTITTYLDKQAGQREVINTAIESSGILSASVMQDKKRKKITVLKRSGPEFRMPIYTIDHNAKTFIPGGANDFIGSGVSFDANSTHENRSPINDFQVYFAYLAANIRISEIQLKQAAMRRQLFPFLDNQLSSVMTDMAELLSSQVVSGTGNGVQGTLAGVTGSAAENLYGLFYQNRRYSGVANANTANNSDNSHFGVARHTQPIFVGNDLNAADVDPGDASTWVDGGDLDAVTLTSGSTEITLGGAATDLSPNIGWEIYYRANGTSDPYTRMGRGFVIADANAGAAGTVQMARQWTGATGAAAYDIQLRPFFNSSVDGAASELTVNKVLTAYGYASSSSTDFPDIALCNTRHLTTLRKTLQQQERYPGVEYKENRDLSASGFDNIMVGKTTFLADDWYPDGIVDMFNTKYIHIATEEGFDRLQIGKDGLRSGDAAQIKSKVGEMVYSCQPLLKAPNRCVRISGLTI